MLETGPNQWSIGSHLELCLTQRDAVNFWNFVFNATNPTESNKEMNRQELLNQPMRVQIAGLQHTVKLSLSE